MLIPWWLKGLALASLLLFAGIYGYTKGKAVGDVKIAQIAKQKSDMAAEYERQLSEKKVEIVTRYVDKWNVIKEKEVKYVEQASNNVPHQHDMSNGWVYLHDSAARATEAEGTRSADASTSGIADNQALATIVTNYSLYHQCAAQVKSLQDLIEEHNKAVDLANTKKR